MRTSEHIGKFAEAFAVAQSAFEAVSKNRTVTVTKKAGGQYTFDYATFDEILRCTVPHLVKAGIAFAQCVGRDEIGHVVTTRLMHASGEWIESDTPIFESGEGAQAFGSGITYAKRYGLSAMLGVAAEEDDDGNAADGNRATYQDRKSNPPPKQAPATANGKPPQSNGAAPSPQWQGFKVELDEMLKLNPEIWPSWDAIKSEVVEIAGKYRIDPATMAAKATVDQVANLLISLKQRGNARLEALQKQTGEFAGIL